jgi:putative nucleotidyltransferase with HDIG domain
MNKKEIQKIYREFQVPKHIIAHMKVVAKVAKKLAKKIKKNGKKIDEELVENAALLHDVVRYVDFKNIKKEDPDCWENFWKKYHKIGHEKAMAKILQKRGENKLAKLISKHGFLSVWKLKTLEEKILYYADKRVDRDKIVSLKVRFEEGKKRNSSPKDDPQLIIDTEKKVFELEQELAQILGEIIYQL